MKFPAPGTRAWRLGASLLLGALAVGAAWGALAAREAARGYVRRSWMAQTEELGAFTRRALDRGSDLLVVERLAALIRRDDVSYAVVMDPEGRALIHTDVTQAGKVYDSEYARRALAATEVIVQEVNELDLAEVDAPLGTRGVLRVGYLYRPLRAYERSLLAGLAFALAGIAAGALLAFRTAGRLQ